MSHKLDFETVKQVVAQMKAEERLVAASTHNEKSLLLVGDRYLVVVHGTTIHGGTSLQMAVNYYNSN